MLKIENLCVKYADGNQVIDNVTIHIHEGETVGIVGANGAGKSTLFKSIVGIMMPDRGNIDVNGIRLMKKNVKEIRDRVGIVFQNPDDQLFMSNVYDDIAFGPRNQGMDEESIEEKLNNITQALGIDRLMTQHSSKLSGGEKRIIAIATVLVMRPSLVLFDEPSSFLDPKTRRKLISLLKQLNLTKLLATHDLDMALELCDRVIVLKDGKVFLDGATKDILTNESLLLEAGLELPFCLQRYEL